MHLKKAMRQYSTILGNNAMLVQGAGGNVSWKEDEILWVKASGTWLAEAEKSDIFISMDLKKIHELIDAGISDFTTASLSTSTLRPSIETSLHALLPQPIVIHVHAIDILAKAVLSDAKNHLTTCLAGLNWLWVDYVTPGFKLTQKIADIINASLPPDILVLGNHGLVIAGNSVDQVNVILQNVLMRCRVKPRMCILPGDATLDKLATEWTDTDYVIPENSQYHSLSLDTVSLALTRQKWVIYPDHAIFLGAHAVFKNELLPKEFLQNYRTRPPCIFIENQGVVINKHFSRAQHAMLQCYVDVVTRLPDPTQVAALNKEQILELVHWDAEKYRQSINTV